MVVGYTDKFGSSTPRRALQVISDNRIYNKVGTSYLDGIKIMFHRDF